MEKKYPIGGYAPGNYECKCCICGNMFTGDKRAVQCEPCLVSDKKKFDALSPAHQELLVKRHAAMANIMLTYKGSGEQIIANQEAGMPLEEAIFQAGYTSGYDNGYERGKREAGHGTVWVKASEFEIEYGPNYYAKWLDGKVKANGRFQDDGTFIWNVPGYIPIGRNEYDHLFILDESPGEKKVDPDELWDEFSEHIDDDIDSLSKVAGSSVMTKEGFKKMMEKVALKLTNKSIYETKTETTGRS